MALPIVSKPWQFDVNIALPSTGTALGDHQALMWTMKQRLVTSGQFDVLSASVVTARDDSDLWKSPMNLAWGTPGSWIVLRRTAPPRVQLLIDLLPVIAGRYDTCRAYLSLQGFTGGTTTARPTAPDEAPLVPATNVRAASAPRWKGSATGTASAFSAALHYAYSADGTAQRFVLFDGGVCRMLFDLQEPVDGTPGWTPLTGIWRSGASYQILHREWCGAAIHAGTPWQFVLGTEGYVAGALGERQTVAANELDAAYPLTPASVVSMYPGARGRHGVLRDLWFGAAQLVDGDMYPADNSKQFVTAGDVVVPWNGVNILLG